MDRFNEVWATIIAKFEEVINAIKAILAGFGGIIGGDDSENA